ncbi:hypothetical protein NEOLI_000526 [Neolecta irregularis DAH-3]|uniref:Uncharacterized protein n=1 Tax=Neolecta irregularis (strain DAH-3) TaxID=1198029 RepID=A0A1U7LRX7_NEOID|nr:hypothetical protein NEOLI_000526 [Neolecta irregularis DAH-3]|eukprot:OLL25430.1 hypothetical protein NEOLI_000526 [Neolecta irregularis DAH-3]
MSFIHTARDSSALFTRPDSSSPEGHVNSRLQSPASTALTSPLSDYDDVLHTEKHCRMNDWLHSQGWPFVQGHEHYNLPSHNDPFHQILSIHPLSPKRFIKVVNYLTERILSPSIAQSVCNSSVFEGKEQILKAAIILIHRFSKINYIFDLDYIISSAIVVSFKFYSPDSEFNVLELRWWGTKFNVTKAIVKRWEIQFLKDLRYNVLIDREEWSLYEKFIDRL